MFQKLVTVMLQISYGMWRMPKIGIPAAVVVTLLFRETGLSLMMATVATGLVWLSVLIPAFVLFSLSLKPGKTQAEK